MSSWPHDNTLCQTLQALGCVTTQAIDLIRHGSNQEYLETLTILALDPLLTTTIYTLCHETFTELCHRWSRLDSSYFIARLAAISRLIQVAPDLAVHANQFLTQSSHKSLQRHDHIARFLNSTPSDTDELPIPQLNELLLAFYRLILGDKRSFSCFLSVKTLTALLNHENIVTRYLGVRLFCLKLDAADASIQRLLAIHVGESEALGQWEGKEIDYIFLPAWEKFRQRELHHSFNASQSLVGRHSQRLFSPNDLSCYTLDIGGLYLSKSTSAKAKVETFIETASTVLNLRRFAQEIKHSDPILIVGHHGTGKSALINALAVKMGAQSNMITIYLNEQTDAKSLLGVFTTSEDSKSFLWAPGVLTNAVSQGHWVVVEDLNRASPEALNILSSLIRRRRLDVSGHNKTIHAATGFRLIATLQSASHTIDTRNLLSKFVETSQWRIVPIVPQNADECWEIVETRFPTLKLSRGPILSVFSAMADQSPQFSRSGSDLRNTAGRSIGIRHLLKWCQRTHHSLCMHPHMSLEGYKDEMYWQAVTCFAGHLPDALEYDRVASRIAEILVIPSSRAHSITRFGNVKYQDNGPDLEVGRFRSRKFSMYNRDRSHSSPFTFSLTKATLKLMEQIGVAVQNQESILLVGETGCGKTTVVQRLAESLGQKLIVLNLSQQSESGDLLGGLRPLNIQSLANSINTGFQSLLGHIPAFQKSQRYLVRSANHTSKGEWHEALKIWIKGLSEAKRHLAHTYKAISTFEPNENGRIVQSSKKRKVGSADGHGLRKDFQKIETDLEKLAALIEQGPKGRGFSFVESNFVHAVRNGHWVLLDELNLAPPESLEIITDLLRTEADTPPSLLLLEKAESSAVVAHPDFRLFGAMNPSTDVGKRDLPAGIRSRFTEIFVHSPENDRESLSCIVEESLGSTAKKDQKAKDQVVDLYLVIKQLAAANEIVDCTSQRPHFSLRTLTRALRFASTMEALMGTKKALYEAFIMGFTTTLDRPSRSQVLDQIRSHIFGPSVSKSHTSRIHSLLERPMAKPQDGNDHISFNGYWIKKGHYPVNNKGQYIITPFVKNNIIDVVRAMSLRQFPILIQGPTSSGKTSMIRHLADITGNKFVRINNHEHTDLQEYLGAYATNEHGQLFYKEGVLVQALRKGHWIVLDELNLAPTDVLEALNRLLDDNRELFIPETQSVVRPHPDFMLFATQNPSGTYGGRKLLSRALRNRFLELHFSDIPQDELEIILQKNQRPAINPRHCSIIASIYRDLAVVRQSERVFEQKNSFATLRDLFRWAKRPADNYEQLAINGYILLAERVRNLEDKSVVKKIIESRISQKVPRFSINEAVLYSAQGSLSSVPFAKATRAEDLTWTHSLRRTFILVDQALRNGEPVLLVGETGCGKTTICEILAAAYGKPLQSFNAHQNMEAGDLIGSQRPIRHRAVIQNELTQCLKTALSNKFTVDELDSASIEDLEKYFDSLPFAEPTSLSIRIQEYRRKYHGLFEWVDGVLIKAMEDGSPFLLDEISLADDSVLERLNSLLEPERQMLLAEKGSNEVVSAKEGFHLMATMNPGGDYGKKELSPALRNRFTEIWVPPIQEKDEIVEIVKSLLKHPRARISFPSPMVDFTLWYNKRYYPTRESISIRDVKSWIQFIDLDPDPSSDAAFVEGAALIYIDTLGANPAALVGISSDDIPNERLVCVQKLGSLFGRDLSSHYFRTSAVEISSSAVKIGRYSTGRGQSSTDSRLKVDVASTSLTASRLIRALQLKKPILIEGDPGVGKSFMITELAHLLGKPLTRINLSEQTDLVDLFGSDVPRSDASPGSFAWQTGAFLRALQEGHWILLDEINLASQSVLEGLNSCLDYRRSIYISDIDQTFDCHPDFVIFGAQNPHHQGGGRKGLPSSFVNRFTVVYAEKLSSEDIFSIAKSEFPSVEEEVISTLVEFVVKLDQQVSVKKAFGFNGAPWEFNLRDILRWLSLIASLDKPVQKSSAVDFIDLLFGQRFRLPEDHSALSAIARKVFGESPFSQQCGKSRTMSEDFYQVGNTCLLRDQTLQLTDATYQEIRPRYTPFLESIMVCVQQKWPCLLVGSGQVGPLLLVKHIASILGAELVETSLDIETDTADLIGGYEQKSNMHELAIHLLNLKLDAQRMMLSDTKAHSSTRLKDLLDCTNACIENQSHIPKLCSRLKELASHRLLSQFSSVSSTILNIYNRDVSSFSFEWMDGILVRAITRGHWLVLENANCCNPSVLDRLNSLLEPEGVLIITEQHAADGKPRVVIPHPDFRIFLIMDPKNGQLSRAMRNRAVEIFVPLEELPGYDSRTRSQNLEYHDSWLVPFESLASDLDHDKASSNVSDPTIDTALTYMPIRSLKMLDRWHNQVMKGLAGGVGAWHETLNQRIHTMFPFLNSEVTQRCRELFNTTKPQELTTPWDYADSRSLHPLTLSTVLSKGDVEDAGYIELLATVLESTFSLIAIDHGLRNANLSRPASQSSLMQHKDWQRQEVLSFLAIILASVFEVMHMAIAERMELSLQTTILIQKLLRLLLMLTQKASQNQLPAEEIQAGLAVLNALVQVKPSSSAIDIRLSNSISPRANKLASTWRGGDQNLGVVIALWKLFQPLTPQSREASVLMRKIDQLAEDLDASIWQESLSRKQAKELRENFLSRKISILGGALTDVHSHELEKILYQKKPSAISQTLFAPYFQNIFTVLLQHHDLYTALATETKEKSQDYSDDWDRISFYSRRALKYSPRYCSSGNLGHRLLESLQNYMGRDISCSRPLVIQGLLPRTIIDACAGISRSSIGHLDNLPDELESLSGLITRQLMTLASDQIQLVTSLFTKLVEVIIRTCLPRDSASEARVNFSNDVLSVFPIDLNVGSEMRDLTEEFFRPGLQNLIKSSVDDSTISNRLMMLSQALLFFSLGFLKLYIPSAAYDPALQGRIGNELKDLVSADLRRKLDMLSSHEARESSNTKSLRVDLARRQQNLLDNQAPEKAVYRSTEYSLSSLQPPFSALLKVINDLINDTKSHDASSVSSGAERTLLTRKNLASIQKRLSSSFEEYQDVIYPAISWMKCLDFGFELQAVVNSQAKSPSRLTEMSVFVPFVGPQAAISLGPFESLDAFRLLGFSNCLYVDWPFNPVKRQDKSPDQTTVDLFYYAYLDWRRGLARDRKNAAAKERSYRYRGAEDEDQDDEEKQILAMFPTFEAENETHDETSANEFKLEHHAAEISDIHSRIFLESEGPDSAIIRYMRTRVQSLSSTHDLTSASDSKLAMQTEFPSLLVSLDRASDYLACGGLVSRDINFYKSPSLRETKKLAIVLREVIERFSTLRDAWPEHMTIQEVIKLSYETLKLPNSEPLARLIQRAEMVQERVHEWQLVTSREFSASTQFELLTRLIIDWRRLELSTWSHLFDTEVKDCVDTAKSWWFIAYEATVERPKALSDSPTELSNYSKELISTLLSFLQKTSIGQYSERVLLLIQMKAHLGCYLNVLPQLKCVLAAVSNCIDYASTFRNKASEIIREGRLKLQKEIEEVILLASWKDTNITALKNSSKHSHRKLFKVVQRFRTLLGQSVESIFRDSILPIEFNAQHSRSLATSTLAPVSSSWLESTHETAQAFDTRPSWLLNPMRTAGVIVEKVENFISMLNLDHLVTTLREDLTDSITHLKQETPSILTDSNKDFCKRLKDRKRKLFARTLNDLRRLGVTCVQQSSSFVEKYSNAALLAVECPLLQNENDPLLSEAQKHFLSFSHDISRTRDISKHRNQELSPKEHTRGIGFINGLADILVLQKTRVAKWLRTLNDLRNLVEKVNTLSGLKRSEIDWTPSAVRLGVRLLQKRILWVPSVLRTCQALVRIQSAFSDMDHSILNTELEHLTLRFESLRELWQFSSLNISEHIWSAQTCQTHKDSESAFSNLYSHLHEWNERFPGLSPLFYHILQWLNHTEDRPTTRDKPIESDQNLSMTQFESVILQVCSSILLAIEDLDEKRKLSLDPSAEISFRSTSNGDLYNLNRILQGKTVAQNLELLLSALDGMSREYSPGSPSSLLVSILPILNAYLASYQQTMQRYLELHLSTCHLASFLAANFYELTNHGFCSPVEKSSTGEGKENVEGGVGLGDGEGAEDISHEVGDDEDLSELAQESKSQMNNENIKDENAAIDAQDDLDAGSENEEETHDGDGNSDASEEAEADEIDEEVGNLGDMDPSTVDEKFWGSDKPKEEPETSESAKRSGESTGNEVPQSEEKQMDDEALPVEDAQDEVNEESDPAEADHQSEEILQNKQDYPEEAENLDLPDDMDIGGPSPELNPDGDVESDISELDGVEETRNTVTAHDDEMSIDEEDNRKAEPISQPSVDNVNKDEDSLDPSMEPNDLSKSDQQMQGSRKDIDEDVPSHEDTSAQSPRPTSTNVHSQAIKNSENGGELPPEQLAAETETESADADQLGSGEANSKDNEVQATSYSRASQRQLERSEEIFKKLGDTIERWHRPRQDIGDANDEQAQSAQNFDQFDNDLNFEHLLNDGVEHDAQAVGAASGTQPMTLDDSMAIETHSITDEMDTRMDQDSETKTPEPDIIPNSRLEKSAPQDADSTANGTDGIAKGFNNSFETEDTGNLDNDISMDSVDHQLATINFDPQISEQSRETSQKLWAECESRTSVLAHTLTEQLRLILTPTQATRMQGDFRTGKRLNIKRIIPYIASDYKRDKIWMRRSAPSKRNYQIMLAIDDSQSMADDGRGITALETLALVGRSLEMLDVGQIAVVSFGKQVKVAHPFDKPFTRASGIEAFQTFKFDQPETDISQLVQTSLSLFADARFNSGSMASSSELWQLQLIVSDGICPKHESIRRLVRQAREDRVMIVFIIIDGSAPNANDSILKLPEARFEMEDGEMRVKMGRYMDTFPFQYYLVVHDIKQLPAILSQALKSWFQEVTS